MPYFAADKLAHWSAGTWRPCEPPYLSGFSNDTRNLRPGDLFVALTTPRRDGHDFLEDARARGAAGALVTRFHPEVALPQLVVDDTLRALQTIAGAARQEYTSPVIGITGSAGKTSTKELLALLLGEEGVLRTYANHNNHLGVPLTLLEIDDICHRYAVVEAGMNHPGEMDVLARLIEPDFAIVTLVAPAHLEGVGTIEGVAAEKSRMLAHLRPGGTAFFPESCLAWDAFRQLPADAVVLSPVEGLAVPASGRHARVQFRIDPSERRPNGLQLSLRQAGYPDRCFQLPRLSPGMVHNAAMALLTASRLGISDSLLQTRLLRWHPATFRGQIVELGPRAYYVDCYNANPASMRDSLAGFAIAFPDRPRLYILGCMAELGPQSADLHRQLGRDLQVGPGDRVFLLGEDAAALREGILETGLDAGRVAVLEDIEEARLALERFSGAVLLKGSRTHRLELLLPDDWEFALRLQREAAV